MRIHYVSHASIPSREANSLQVMKMCAALARAGHEVVLFCAAGPEPGDPHGTYAVPRDFELVRVRDGDVPWVSRFLYSWRVRGRLERRPPADLLYGRDFHTLALALRGSSAPIVLEVHQPPRNGLERTLQRALFRSPRFRLLVAISSALAAEYRRLFGKELRAPIAIAPDGADLPPAADARGASSARQDLALGYVGNLYPGKGMEEIQRLAARLPRCSFHVIGGSSADIRDWKRRIDAPNVIFHGHLPHAAAQAKMRELDILLAPYQRAVLIGSERADIGRWMSPLKIFEYMGSGKPMIASDLPVLREVLRDGENALLAPPGDVEAWMSRIRALADDRALGKRLAERAREDLVRHYTWDRRTECLLAELARVNAGSAAARVTADP